MTAAHCKYFLSLTIAAFVFQTTSAQADDIEKGKAVYNGIGACATCHGALGAGDGPAGGALTPKPRSLVAADYLYDTDKDGKKGTETDIFNIISSGAVAYGGSPMMVGRPDIPEADRKALTKYVLSLKK